MPKKQPKRSRLWFNDGSCIRLRADYPNHVWSYDIVFDLTHDGWSLRTLVVVDDYTRECLSIDVVRRLKSESVLYRLSNLFVQRGAHFTFTPTMVLSLPPRP